VAGREMRTYHEWMKSALLVTLEGSPALVVPAASAPRRINLHRSLSGLPGAYARVCWRSVTLERWNAVFP